MPWKVGGNFETVAVTCETSWKECVIAVANYLWSEVVSDVVDYLAKEGIIWVLAIAITSTMLIRIKYCKNMHTQNSVLNKRILNKVGYKIQDLELKINVLTYKMQYGTWPLPHQICNMNPKLRKIRLTLSNPGDRKNWLKHVLLSPSSENSICASYSNALRSSKTKLKNRFDDKRQECDRQHVKHRELSIACSSTESLKSTSDQSVNIYSQRPGTYSQNARTKENGRTKSKDFTLQERNVQLIPLDPNVINHQSSRIIRPLTQSVACATNVRYNPCQEFTDTVSKCKSFLKELQYNDKRLRSSNYSSEMSEVSLKATHAAKRTVSPAMEKRETSYGAPAAAKKGETNEMKCVKRIKDNTAKGTTETYCSDEANASNDVVVSNNREPSRDLVSIVPIKRTTHNAQPCRETLHEVRRRLRSLHNVLQTYQDTSQLPERQESVGRVDEADSSVTFPVVDISSEYFELNRSEGSLSSLAEYSSRSSKTYQRSSKSVTLRNTRSKGFSRHNIRASVGSKLPAFVTTESHLCFRNATSEEYEDECERSAWERNTLDRSSNHELESNPETNKDAETDALFNARDGISETISERMFYILSPENKSTQTQNKASLKRRFAAENLSDEFDKEEENVTITQNSSRNKMPNSREDKSTALLLQQALHFKNALLSRKRYPSDVKQGDIADEFPPVSNNNFPPMIIDIKEEAPAISNPRDKINQRYICLEMKQRRDVLPRSLNKVNTLARRDDKRDAKSQDYVPKTSSEYFSITDLAVHNNTEIENNVALAPPIYEKVISITIPVSVKGQGEINMNERPTQTKTILRDIQARVKENFTEKKNVASDIGNIVIDKRPPAMLKLEDLILERVKNIRDYMDTFLQSQNTAIFKARRALQCQGKSNTFRCSDEASHVVIYNRSAGPSSCNSTEQVINSSKNSSDFLPHEWPNSIQEYKQETDDVLKCSSDMYLKRNPGMFALTPIKNKFSNETRQLEATTKLEREEAELSLLTYSHESDSKSTHDITNFFTPRCEELMRNVENDKIDKGTTVDVNMNFDKRSGQTQITESKPSTISYFPLNVANANTKVIHVARDEYPAKSNCNSISHSNSYFTDEEMMSDVKMDNASAKSTSNTSKHSHAKSTAQKEKQQSVIKRQISADEGPDANTAKPSKLPSDNEYSNLTTLINSSLILDKSEHDYSTNAKAPSPLTMLKENDFIFEPGASFLPFSSDKENKTLNDDGVSSSKFKHDKTKNDVNTVHLSPRMERYTVTESCPTYSRQIKAKSDISLVAGRKKDLKAVLHQKKSHSFLMRHNTVEYISGALHQPYAKLFNDKNKCIKNKLRLATQSKSIISPRRVSTKSCIPILRNRLESPHRMECQAQARSPTRSPLTMLCVEKTRTRVHRTDEEIARSDNVSMNKHLETASNLAKLDTGKDTLDKKLDRPENIMCRNSEQKSSGVLPSDQNVESLATDKNHSDTRDICDSKSDTSIIQHMERIASKELVVISIMTNDGLRKKYPADLFILNTKNISPTSDLLIHKNKLWSITVEKTEKEVTARPSITDTCTSTSSLQ